MDLELLGGLAMTMAPAPSPTNSGGPLSSQCLAARGLAHRPALVEQVLVSPFHSHCKESTGLSTPRPAEHVAFGFCAKSK